MTCWSSQDMPVQTISCAPSLGSAVTTAWADAAAGGTVGYRKGCPRAQEDWVTAVQHPAALWVRAGRQDEAAAEPESARVRTPARPSAWPTNTGQDHCCQAVTTLVRGGGVLAALSSESDAGLFDHGALSKVKLEQRNGAAGLPGCRAALPAGTART
ncbi:uncharacterized protein UV8b_05225 [Ustilaginoidea virens]|uniref:Uncharacterized protein n=1 Tax=Ustilaginoidea virens TaxID=1159556 RepID=A0A8E5HTL4_USTVR|nr:uncharacterized protein UV8b_05225 [Ustilaginoidea virens]QUC20984.1 hypothetical protein UV8b_05225 [Ustilaginoidea virens]